MLSAHAPYVLHDAACCVSAITTAFGLPCSSFEAYPIARMVSKATVGQAGEGYYTHKSRHFNSLPDFL